jgi:hypothetical protein
MGAQKRVRIKHEKSSIVKNGYIGYCWTYFFIGGLVPIIRGEIGIGLLHMILSLITFGVFQVIMPFLYNKQYMIRQLTNGYQLSDSEELMQLAKVKLNIAA